MSTIQTQDQIFQLELLADRLAEPERSTLLYELSELNVGDEMPADIVALAGEDDL